MELKKFAYIDLPYPYASKKDLQMSTEEAKRARLYFQDLVNRFHIWVKKPKPGFDGLCDYFRNTIYVPTIRNQANFFLCLHEVGHLRQQPAHFEVMNLDPDLEDEAKVMDEYAAEIFALEHARLFGLDTTVYDKHARRYVFTYVQKVHQKGTEWADLHERVRDIITEWLGITEADWLAQEWRLID